MNLVAIDRDKTYVKHVPHEPGAWIEFRLITWADLQKARQIRLRVAEERISLTEDEELNRLGELLPNAAPLKPEELHDMESILRDSIVAWSYDARVRVRSILRLDEVTATWAFKTALDLALSE